MHEFPNKFLSISVGKLFCIACGEELGPKASISWLHIKSLRHKRGVDMRLGWRKIPIVQQVYRIKVVTAFFRVGIPLNKIDSFRELLEENVTCLAGQKSLSNLILSSTGKLVRLSRR